MISTTPHRYVEQNQAVEIRISITMACSPSTPLNLDTARSRLRTHKKSITAHTPSFHLIDKSLKLQTNTPDGTAAARMNLLSLLAVFVAAATALPTVAVPPAARGEGNAAEKSPSPV
jgi:hypothetical protein